MNEEKSVFTPEEEKMIQKFLDENKELMKKLAELEEKEKIDKQVE
jgi:hypothetical protein